jgi:TonB-linked SusC/RagA family outer membrane protein
MIQKLKKLLLLICVFSAHTIYAQTTTVSGTVTDSSDQMSIPGVNVVEKGTTNGAITDFDGNYTIKVSGENAVLQFSFLGYMDIEVAVNGQDLIDVALEESSEDLDEVVITALGISREKKSLGYAVSEVSGDNVNTIKDNNLASSLAGKVAGLQISQSGSLGSASRITIRGNNSLGGNSQALIVVDGMPINASLPINSDGSQANSGSQDNGGSPSYEPSISGAGISDINPDDVESITVLKGPSAAALYGSRAGNGVILITTKKGSSSNKLGVSLKTNVSFDSPMLLPEHQNQYGQGSFGTAYTDRESDWGQFSWGGTLDGSQQAYYDGTNKAYSAESNNVEDFFRQAVRSITSVSVDKGSDMGSIRFSYTNNSSNSIIENSDLSSHNFNLRAVNNLSDKLTVDTKATFFTQDVNNRASTTGAQGLLSAVYNMPRNVAIDDLRNYQMANPATPEDYNVIRYADGNVSNPFWQIYNDETSVRRNRFLGFAKVNYQFTDWLSAFVRIGGDMTSIRDNKIYRPGHHFINLGSMEIGESTFKEINSEFLVTAKRDLTDKINIVANIGGNMSKRTSEGLLVRGSDFKIPTASFINNLNVIQAPEESPLSIKKVNSVYGSVNLAYDNFLYLDVSTRNDWSSTLSEDNRSYLYNSASVSAILNKFIDPNKEIFNLIKVRGSVAQVGNDTDPYQLNQTYSVPGQGYLGLTTLVSPTIRLNQDLKPETVTSSEFGLELGLLNNKLTLDLSVYNMTTKDLIFDVPVPAATGYLFNRDNIGKVTNKGVEIALGATVFDKDDFSWNTSFFYSKNENKIEELIEGVDSFRYNTSTDGNVAIVATEGGSIGDIYGRVWTGEVDADGVPIGSAAPDELLGNAQPDWLGGWSNTLTYKNFSMSFLIDARMGGQVYSQTSADMDRNGVSLRSLQYRQSGVVVAGTNTGTGAANTQSITGQQYWTAMSDISENYIYDQDNIRLRELAIGYNIPVGNKFGLQSATVQLVGRNLFFLMNKADDIDPESMLGTSIGVQGLSHNAMPTLRSIGLNLNLTF